MSTIIAYHPVIEVQQPDGSLNYITLDLPDYHADETVLAILQQHAGVQTAGELVQKLKTQSGMAVGDNQLRLCDPAPTSIKKSWDQKLAS